MSWCLRYIAFSARSYSLLPNTLRLRVWLALRMSATPCLKNSGDLITVPSDSVRNVLSPESEVHANLTAPVPGFTHGDGAVGGDVDKKLSEYVPFYRYIKIYPFH